MLKPSAGWRAGAATTLAVMLADGAAASARHFDRAIAEFNAANLPSSVIRGAVGIGSRYNAAQLLMFAQGNAARVLVAASYTALDSPAFAQQVLGRGCPQ
jgi:hypothetical protein